MNKTPQRSTRTATPSDSSSNRVCAKPTAPTIAADDWALLDSPTLGVRKYDPKKFGGGASFGVNVKNFGATGSDDDTAAFVSAIASLPATGGTILVPHNGTPYVIGAINITKSNVTIHLDQGAILKRKAGMAVTTTTRAMFCLLGMQPANFRISGQGTIDLNRTAYGDGPACSAIFALRSTYISIERGITVKNSSDSAFTFRNCGHIESHCDIDNIWSIGVEFSGVGAEADGYVGSAPIPTEEHYVVRGHISNVNDNLNGAGNGCGVGFGYNDTAIGRIARGIDVDITCRNNLRDVWWELNGAGSCIQHGSIRLVSHNAKQGCVGGYQAKNLNIDVIAYNPGTEGPRLIENPPGTVNPADIYVVYLSGYESCGNTIGITVDDDRGSATDYLTCALKVASGISFQLKYLNARIVSNPTQPVIAPQAPFKLINITTVSGHSQIGPVRADIINPPAGTVGISQSVGNMVISAMPQLRGFATALFLSGNVYEGFGPNGTLALNDSLIIRTEANGIRSDTADSNDTKWVSLCGGGTFSDARGAIVTLYGNEVPFAPGKLDIRSGQVTGGVISFQAVGEEVMRLVDQYTISDGGTMLMIRRRVGGTYSLVPVTMGAADSGGTGYKVLRVPN